jgi:hypothetical protein
LGAISAFLQFAAIVLYLLLLWHQHVVANGQLGHHLLAISVRMVLLAAVVSLIGLLIDKNKWLAALSLLSTLPILLLMAGWQGIW